MTKIEKQYRLSLSYEREKIYIDILNKMYDGMCMCNLIDYIEKSIYQEHDIQYDYNNKR